MRRLTGILVALVALCLLGGEAIAVAHQRTPVSSAVSRVDPAGNPAAPRTVTLVNRTRVTIWPAASPSAIGGVSGWKLAPGATLSFRVPGNWNGRLWGRTGCRFDAAGHGPCETGGCDDDFQCRGWGSIPATLAEYDMDAYDHLDFYDVSMVDGSNLPMYITTVGGRTPDRISASGCEQGHGCTRAVRCPTALSVIRDRQEVGCISPCARFGTSRYCCSGQYAQGCNPATTWPTDYALVFKRAEPYAYSWSGDDATSTFTCAGGCGYRITFGLTPPAVGGPPG